MSKRSLTWLRQHTNVEDLLDDGVENNSDLQSFATGEEAGEELSHEPTNSHALVTPSRIPAAEPTRPDYFVAAIGVFFIGCGLKLFFYPELVSYFGSEIFGCVGVVFGAIVLFFSIFKWRN